MRGPKACHARTVFSVSPIESTICIFALNSPELPGVEKGVRGGPVRPALPWRAGRPRPRLKGTTTERQPVCASTGRACASTALSRLRCTAPICPCAPCSTTRRGIEAATTRRAACPGTARSRWRDQGGPGRGWEVPHLRAGDREAVIRLAVSCADQRRVMRGPKACHARTVFSVSPIESTICIFALNSPAIRGCGHWRGCSPDRECHCRSEPRAERA